jgi:hypothetical protein
MVALLLLLVLLLLLLLVLLLLLLLLSHSCGGGDMIFVKIHCSQQSHQQPIHNESRADQLYPVFGTRKKT